MAVEAKVDPCGVCGKTAKINCIRSKTCQKWIRARCDNLKRVTDRMNGQFECRVCSSEENDDENGTKQQMTSRMSQREWIISFTVLG